MQRNKALISGRDGEIRQLNLAECIDCFLNTSIVKASVLLSNMSDFQSVYFEFQRVWTCSLLDMICFREQAVTLTSIKSVPDNTYKYINLQSSFPVAVSKI